MLAENVTVGLSLSGALTPAGLGASCVVPLIQAGFVDWIVSTGANLYHDTHFGLGMELHAGSPFLDDRVLHEEGVVRIYDILFDYDVLLDTDAFFRRITSYNVCYTKLLRRREPLPRHPLRAGDEAARRLPLPRRPGP